MVKWFMVPWACIVLVIAVIYRFTLQALWDVIFNAFWYIRMLFDRTPGRTWREVTVQLNERLDFGCISFHNFAGQMSRFKYIYDGALPKAPRGLKFLTMWPTWTARPRVTVYRGFRGNCQDAEIFARKMLRRLQKNVDGVIIDFKKQIYVPLDPTRLEHTHYIVSGWMREKGQNIPFVVSNNHVIKCMLPDESARNLLSRAGTEQYVWITRKPWTVSL
jgi:hypothetical protein